MNGGVENNQKNSKLFIIIAVVFFALLIIGILIYYQQQSSRSKEISQEEMEKLSKEEILAFLNPQYGAAGRIISMKDVENKIIEAELIIPAPILLLDNPENFKRATVLLKIDDSVNLIDDIEFGDLKENYLFKITTKEDIFYSTPKIITPLSFENALKKYLKNE